ALVGGEGPAEIDLIDAHLVVGEGVGLVSGEGHQAAFGDAVGEEIGCAAVGVDGADVEDGAAGFFQVGAGGANQKHGGAAVEVDDAVENFGGGFFDGGAGGGGGVVHQAVDSAVSFDREVDEFVGVLGLADVVAEEGGVGGEAVGDAAAEEGFEAMNHDLGAFGDAAAGDGFADALGAAGDEDDFVFETHTKKKS